MKRQQDLNLFVFCSRQAHACIKSGFCNAADQRSLHQDLWKAAHWLPQATPNLRLWQGAFDWGHFSGGSLAATLPWRGHQVRVSRAHGKLQLNVRLCHPETSACNDTAESKVLTCCCLGRVFVHACQWHEVNPYQLVSAKVMHMLCYSMLFVKGKLSAVHLLCAKVSSSWSSYLEPEAWQACTWFHVRPFCDCRGGFIVYSTSVPKAALEKGGILDLGGPVHDYAQVSSIDRYRQCHQVSINESHNLYLVHN